MFQRIIGLDIGSFSIKMVLMQKGLKGPSIEKCMEWPVASLQGEADQKDLYQKLSAAFHKTGIRSFAIGGLEREVVVASVPQQTVFTHVVRLPFTDPQQVAQTVAYEMEGQIPLDLEEVVVDYHPILPSVSGGSGQSDSTVLAVAIPREHLKRRLEGLHQAGVDPKALEIDSLALFNFSQHYLKDLKGDTALLDIGDSKTSVCIVGEGSPWLVRTVRLGGRHLTQAIAQAQNLSLEQAEQEKRKAILTGTDDVEAESSRILKDALSPLIKELATTFHVYETESGRPIHQIYVCGGTSRLQGLSVYLAHQLGKESVRGPEIMEDGTFAVGIGLALKECLGPRGSRVRFRSGEFAYRQEQAQSRHRLVALGAAAAVLLLLAGGDIYLRYHLKMARYQELQSRVRTVFQQIFPNVKTLVNEVEQTKAAQKEIDKKVAFFGGGTVTVLNLLGELTRRMPNDRVIEVSDLLIEQDDIRMEAQADSFESVEKFKAILEKYEQFREVTISDARMSADQSKVRFRVNITLTEAI
jgi:general secretion pathway protein L